MQTQFTTGWACKENSLESADISISKWSLIIIWIPIWLKSVDISLIIIWKVAPKSIKTGITTTNNSLIDMRAQNRVKTSRRHTEKDDKWRAILRGTTDGIRRKQCACQKFTSSWMEVRFTQQHTWLRAKTLQCLDKFDNHHQHACWQCKRWTWNTTLQS
jgi:hypothetical protein